MNKFMKWISLLLVAVLLCSVVGCGKDEGKKPSARNDEEDKVDMSAYIGTWQGSDHDGENVVHYLVFGESGYWYVYMNRESLARAIGQRGQYVSFKVTFEGDADKGTKPLNVSAHTGCYYEYVEYGADAFSMDENGEVSFASAKNVLFTKVSGKTGQPDKTYVDQAKDLFDRAKEQADEAKEQ